MGLKTKKEYNIKKLIWLVLVLVVIDSLILIITDGFNKDLIKNIALYVIEILGTIWVAIDSNIFKK